jgi:hypothetical protein
MKRVFATGHLPIMDRFTDTRSSVRRIVAQPRDLLHVAGREQATKRAVA